MSNPPDILFRIIKEPVFMKYSFIDIAFRSEPGPPVKFYAKYSKGDEHVIHQPEDIVVRSLMEAIEITREEYERF
jgi:hypothetical protein